MHAQGFYVSYNVQGWLGHVVAWPSTGILYHTLRLALLVHADLQAFNLVMLRINDRINIADFSEHTCLEK